MLKTGQQKSKQKTKTAQQTPKTKCLLTCTGNNKVFQVCAENQCDKHSAIICSGQSCECQLDHEHCRSTNINSSIKFVQQKITDTQDFKKFIQKMQTQMIEKIKETFDHFLLTIETDMKLMKLFSIEKKFLKIVSQEKSTENESVLTPQDSALLWKIRSQKQVGSNKVMQTTKNLLQQLKNTVCKSLDTVKQCVSETIKKQEKRNEKRLDEIRGSFEKSITPRSSQNGNSDIQYYPDSERQISQQTPLNITNTSSDSQKREQILVDSQKFSSDNHKYLKEEERFDLQ